MFQVQKWLFSTFFLNFLIGKDDTCRSVRWQMLTLTSRPTRSHQLTWRNPLSCSNWRDKTDKWGMFSPIIDQLMDLVITLHEVRINEPIPVDNLCYSSASETGNWTLSYAWPAFMVACIKQAPFNSFLRLKMSNMFDCFEVMNTQFTHCYIHSSMSRRRGSRFESLPTQNRVF